MKGNFKFKVLDASPVWGKDIIIGKIYEVKDGEFKDEDGFIWDKISTFESFKNRFCMENNRLYGFSYTLTVKEVSNEKNIIKRIWSKLRGK